MDNTPQNSNAMNVSLMDGAPQNDKPIDGALMHDVMYKYHQLLLVVS